ncbi:MAG: alpha-glucosidase, partial [Clostridia bacterium]|nr:alpha-glucosidase [Clostridia bacterium]
IPPKFAFGFGQSRWGYATRKDFTDVVANYRKHDLPIDCLYMDIDYMDNFKDFTVNEGFGDFRGFVDEMKGQKIHLVPIIDAGVKIEKGYSVYEEGVKNGYFVKREDGSDMVTAVWPGQTHFPDVLNKDARRWFGDQYRVLVDMGVDGFWNDMNEPAIFYTLENLEKIRKEVIDAVENPNVGVLPNRLAVAADSLNNNEDDYRRMYHNVDGKKVRHDRVHNLFGYNMTRAAGEAFERISPDKRILMFSRSSYIGMHRYGGVWMGDNMSWWSHILLNLRMLTNLNMCGLLYTGADIGGFGGNTTRDLLLRWLALGVFTPLMRNHAAKGTRDQECYRFEDMDDFRHVLGVRYRLVPYLYSEYMKAALNDDMMFKPLAFVYPEDKMAKTVEDQLMLGDEVMIAPVYMQNAAGRYVYLPEDMTFVKFLPDGTISQTPMTKGHHFVEIALNEVPMFIRSNRKVPVVAPARCTEEIDMATLTYIGDVNAAYELYDDDGITPIK